jgi:penicillin-binding protein 1C
MWCLVLVLTGLDGLDAAYPPPLQQLAPRSAMVVDRQGNLLRAFATPAGRWRLPVDLASIDSDFRRMLIAYEDNRFYSHPGVDPLAIARAAGQLAWNGRIVSGGSTLTMQLARLIEARRERSFAAKARQMLRALQIERRLSKDEILNYYLTLAPYGGNLEGIAAASQVWFGKSPRKLNAAEAALLIALPQLPEARRPDRFPAEATAARNRVLERMAAAGVLTRGDAERAKRVRVPTVRRDMPALAAHLAEALRRKTPDATLFATRLDAALQARLERLAADYVKGLGDKVTAALIVADHRSGDILARLGSADFFDARRQGEVDMTVAARSPGSTLKPFIYGLAFEAGLAHPETLIDDRPEDFSGYRPRNFDLAYQGTVSVRQALQLSLNVPAVKLLDGVGPQRLAARLNAAGARLRLPDGDPVGLAIGLGGTGITLEELVRAYAALARGGLAARLLDAPGAAGDAAGEGVRVLDAAAAWYVTDILKGAPAPRGRRRMGIAFKTGTSYGHRDVWSIGYDARHVIGVWIGRADGTPVPELVGIETAAPLLFDAFNRVGPAGPPLALAPPGVLRLKQSDLPVVLRHFVPARLGLVSAQGATPPPVIVHPPAGARIDLKAGAGGLRPLVLKLDGGKAPFRWVANGHLLDGFERRRQAVWTPDGAGFSTLTVIDALGRSARVSVFVE